MNKPEKWKKMVDKSRNAIEDFNDFADDRAIVWADNELRNYRRAMMLLANSNSNWPMSLSDEDEKFVRTMINRAASGRG